MVRKGDGYISVIFGPLGCITPTTENQMDNTLENAISICVLYDRVIRKRDCVL